MTASKRIVAFLLMVSLLVAIPVHAEAEPRGSIFFSSYATFLHKVSTNTFQVWFTVDSNLDTMYELGTSVIEVYRSSDLKNWTLMRTYRKASYPDMIDEDTGSHTGYVTYSYATPGYYYRAYVTFYAKNSNGVGERYIYTEPLRM